MNQPMKAKTSYSVKKERQEKQEYIFWSLHPRTCADPPAHRSTQSYRENPVANFDYVTP